MSDKQIAMKLLEEIEDTATFKDIVYKLYVQYKIQQGLKDMENKKGISTDELLKEVEKW